MYVEGEYVSFIIGIAKDDRRPRYWPRPRGCTRRSPCGGLGARTVLVTRTEFGGMAANDGPVPVRTLAHAARLIREARQLSEYGIGVSEPVLDYPRLLARVREVINDVRAHSSLRPQIDS